MTRHVLELRASCASCRMPLHFSSSQSPALCHNLSRYHSTPRLMFAHSAGLAACLLQALTWCPSTGPLSLQLPGGQCPFVVREHGCHQSGQGGHQVVVHQLHGQAEAERSGADVRPDSAPCNPKSEFTTPDPLIQEGSEGIVGSKWQG